MATSAVTNNALKDLYSTLSTKKDTGTTEVDASQTRFLTLLTTQLKSQDPLNPMDNAQVTSQLAQISTVDGIERLNQALSKLTDSASDTQHLQAAALVGHGVLVEGNQMLLSSGSSFGGYELDSAADKVKITVKDANGLEVAHLDKGSSKAGVFQLAWDGKTDAGTVAADGTYRISIEATRGGEKVTARTLELGVVSSVTRTGSTTGLNVGRLGTVGMEDIKQIL